MLRRLTLLLLIATFLFDVFCTSIHSHKHKGQKERQEDGAYVRRDSEHYDKDGEHNLEFDHAAILGSRTTADEYDSLPPEIAKAKLRELAVKMDENNDREISNEELKTWILKSLSLLSKEESDEKFEEEDENQDGRVSWEEHSNEVFGSYIDENEITAEEDVEQGKLRREDKLLFQAADLNRDEFLSPEEFLAFNSPEEHKHMIDVLYMRTMEEKDQNGDGSLSLSEFIGKISQDNQENFLIEKERFETEYDKNKDGKLDKDEILKWLIPDNDEIAADEAEHLLSEADDNRDHSLSIDEIVNHHEVFVGSDATDYGAHLHDTSKFDHIEL